MWRPRILPHARAAGDRRLDIGLLARGQHDRAHEPHDARHLRDDDGDDDDLPTLPLNSEMSAMASRIAGIAISPSISRMTTTSTGRKKPASRPMTRPIETATIATLRPTASETRAP